MQPPTVATLELKDVAKSFGAVVALRSGSLTLYPGSIHALVGENGAGKSTLVKIIAGLYQRDSGVVSMEGQPVDFKSTAESKSAGIAVIYQEPTLFPDLSVTENVFMGRQPVGRFRRIDRRAMRHEVQSLMTRLGVRIDPDRPAEGLSIADQQIIEIAKAISLDAKVLIMDEPTAALSGVEVDRLFAVARSLRDEGRALMFISHRFDEVFALCDTITVMRDGAYISTDAAADTSVAEIVRRMVGRDVKDLFPKQPATIGDPLLVVDGLNMPGVFHDISFTVRSGEIVGLAGLVGAGRSEVARAVFGVDPYQSGSVTLAGRPVPPGSPSAAMALGLALVPEDRRKQGLVIDSTVGRNITTAIRRVLSKLGLITTSMENAAAQVWASRLEVKTQALDAVAGTLSGGNQQKVVLGKWLATRPKVLIIDEPTRGIDVGTKAEVHRMMSELAGQGLGVLMISSELPEVLGMADRVLVMREGRITAELDRSEATSESVMFAATHAADEVPGVTADTQHMFTPTEPGTTFSSRVGGLARARETGIVLALVFVVAVTTIKNPAFLFSPDGFRDLLLTPAILIVVAIGQAIVIITRNVDLSVGSVLGLTAYLTGRLFIDVPGIPILAVFAIGIVFGGLLGLINGALVAFAKVPALVITLGTLYAYRGINVAWTGSDRIDASDLPRAFLELGTKAILFIPVLTIIAAVVLVIGAWYMKNVRGGREFYAIGSDPAAAELYGLNVTRRVLIAFVVSGALAGLAGVLYTARYGTVNAQAGLGFELEAVGAAVIGGVAIFGGSGTLWGAAFGAMLLVTINRALPVLGVPDFWQRAVVGVLIIGAIVLDRVLSLRQSRRLIEARDIEDGDEEHG